MIKLQLQRVPAGCWLILAMAVTAVVYWPGLSGSWLFDDFPNIVNNRGVKPPNLSLASLLNAALSSPASEFKRPLASLSFAFNYLATGLDPYWMKLTNLAIHLLNGALVFYLARQLVRTADEQGRATQPPCPTLTAGTIATLIALAWMLLPINLTGVLYVVQRMESMANVFVLLGLAGYVSGRRAMLRTDRGSSTAGTGLRGLALCTASIVLGTALGILAKETAVMLPLYALLVEWTLFGFARASGTPSGTLMLPEGPAANARRPRMDWRIATLFVLVLVLPMLVGLTWLMPSIADPQSWAARDFTLRTRLLSEARIVVDYIRWTLLPTPHALSFYHDDFRVSKGLLAPWTTAASIALLAGLAWLMVRLRRGHPLAALGIGLFLGCHLLTATILPLELIYEHRNYFASFGLLLALIPWWLAPTRNAACTARVRMVRWGVLTIMLLFWAGQTAISAVAWGSPLGLAKALADRAPDSPRAQYELGRNYILHSHYLPSSPYTQLAYAPLERAAALPDSSILPEQALIFMNARMDLPLKQQWWDSMIAKLRARAPGVQDESSLAALAQCARERSCNLPPNRMVAAFNAALSHPDPGARLLATYGDYAWSVLDNHALGQRLTEEAVRAAPSEPAYQITLIRMLVAQGHREQALRTLHRLELLNLGGRLDTTISELQQLPALQ